MNLIASYLIYVGNLDAYIQQKLPHHLIARPPLDLVYVSTRWINGLPTFRTNGSLQQYDVVDKNPISKVFGR